MAECSEIIHMEVQEPEIILISDSDEDYETSPLGEDNKEVSPELAPPLKRSIINQSLLPNKRKSTGSSGRKKSKRVLPCAVCASRFATQGNLNLHMRVHWHVFDKMNELLESMINKTKVKSLTHEKCKCSRCTYESNGGEQPYQMLKDFICSVCGLSFFTANKLAKHMDKHRDIYYKMKKLEEEKHPIFFDRPKPMDCERVLTNNYKHNESSVTAYIPDGDTHHL